MGKNVKLKGNESFSIREGWLTKGIFLIKEDSKLFSKKDVIERLGMGSNMVKSLKYWLQTANIITENKKNEYVLSEFGEMIYKYDPYIEDIFTLYFIHIFIATNIDKAYIWNLFFNKCTLKSFSKRDLLEQMEYLLDNESLEYNEKILQDEISVLLKTYTIDERDTNPENNFTCPLTELKLVKKNSKDNYSKEKPLMNNLDDLVVYYAISRQIEENSINFEDLLIKDNSVGKLLNIDKLLLNEYLDILKNKKIIIINRTAGLNMLYLEKKLSLREIFEEHFERN